MDNPSTAIILAAGAGRRLGQLGRSTSKAMVPLLGRPLVQWVHERLTQAGIRRVVVVAHVDDVGLGEFLRTQTPDVRIVRQSQRRGIADAITQALPEIEDDAYLACACDSLFDAADIGEIIDAGRRGQGSAVVAVQEMGVEATATRSAVEVRDGLVSRLHEKPAAGSTTSPLVALPLYWLPLALTPHLRDAALVGGERHVSTALDEFIAAGGRVSAVTVGRRIEITTAEDIPIAEEALQRRPV